jgi:hypothetical protein
MVRVALLCVGNTWDSMALSCIMTQRVCVTVVCPRLCCASVVLVCVHGTVVSPLHCCMSWRCFEFVALSFF